MERFLEKNLIEWKNSQQKKPLIIYGARQVGKTYLMKDFGKKYYKNICYLDFYRNNNLKEIFATDLNPFRIISQIEILYGKKIDEKETLIIFDEIQEVPLALASLKYFYEEANGYDIIAAGSFLGIKDHEGFSFPVGKVDALNLYPLSFEEYLHAVGDENLINILNTRQVDLINTCSEQYKELLKQYYFVGGMPEVVCEYIKSKNLNKVRNIQKRIIQDFKEDFSKHAKNEQVKKIEMVYENITKQLAKPNKKFQYGLIKKGARAKEFENSIKWLENAGIVYKINKVNKLMFPLASYEDVSYFKLYFLDIGLLLAMGDVPFEIVNEKNDLFVEFKGAMTEQFVLQDLIARGNKLFYFEENNSIVSIDFTLQHSNSIAALEVKAEENLKAKSLKIISQKYPQVKCIRTSMSQNREEEHMSNISLWYAGTFFS